MAEVIQVWRMRGGVNALIEPVVISPEPASLDEGTRLLPGGGYTTFRTYDRFRVLRIADHYRRLEETALLAGNPVQLNREVVAGAIHQALTAYPAQDTRVRVILDLEKQPGDIYLLVESLHTPDKKQYCDGVSVLTRTMQRENPKAKLTSFIGTASAMREELPKDINEVVMIGQDGRLLEGLSSNFFCVREGVIYTADEGVLSGITRLQVFEVIQERALPLNLEGFPAAEVASLEEAFLTSASRAVLPVVEMDGNPVGNAKPGPITRMLQAGYQARVEKELDTL